MSLLSWLKLSKLSGTPEGCRESTRISYDQHLRGALKRKRKAEDIPHHIALYGALASWYKIRRQPIREVVLWAELAPFLLLPEKEAREAIAEYTLYLEDFVEHRYASETGIKIEWLSQLINSALRAAPSGEASLRSMATVGIMNGAAWYHLLDTDVKTQLEAEANKFVQAIESAENEYKSNSNEI
jgi:hypothetical protein